MFYKLLNIAVSLFSYMLLCILLPFIKLYKLVNFIVALFFPEDVRDKVVVITGASSGLGEVLFPNSEGLFELLGQLAYEYAKRGASLVLAARRKKSLDEVANMCLQLGSPDVVVVAADVSNIDDCKQIVESTISHFGRMDHLVSNAGVTSAHMLEEYEDITMARSIMDINFWGSVYLTHSSIPHLRKAKGKMLIISSSGSWVPEPRMSIYNASKAAMLVLYEALRVELKPDVSITIATPGYVESEMTKGKHLSTDGKVTVDQQLRDAQVSVFPVGKADVCAKKLVNSVCRNEMYVTYPTFYELTYWCKVLSPELMEWIMKLLYIPKSRDSPLESLSKKIIDLPGLKEMLYSSTLSSAEIKHE